MKVTDVLKDGVTQYDISCVYDKMPTNFMDTYTNGELLSLEVDLSNDMVAKELLKIVISIDKLIEFNNSLYSCYPDNGRYEISCLSFGLYEENGYKGDQIIYSDGSYIHDCEEGTFYLKD